MLSELVSFAIDDRRTDLCGESSGVVQKSADPAECEAIDCEQFTLHIEAGLKYLSSKFFWVVAMCLLRDFCVALPTNILQYFSGDTTFFCGSRLFSRLDVGLLPSVL